jgi:hypothetical protein
MALKPLSAQLPLGLFDGKDSDYNTIKGGEVMGLIGTLLTGADNAAADVLDGYVGTTSKLRPAATKSLVSGMRPLFLSDDGVANYGTSFGTLVGGIAGRVVTGGTSLGPHTAEGSGKVTLWNQPGLYAVTLDAVDTTALTGLVVDNAGLNVGSPLYATVNGLLTPAIGSAFETQVIARFIEFTANGGTLVNTPNYLVSALNSPSGSAAQKVRFTEAVISFQGVDG